jgi:hypothetical protein
VVSAVELAEVAGARCGQCGGYAQVEPGGYRCLVCGYCPLLRKILPRDHQLSGRDWRNRVRQAALDRTLLRPGRMEEFLFEMLARLEGKRVTT